MNKISVKFQSGILKIFKATRIVYLKVIALRLKFRNLTVLKLVLQYCQQTLP